MSTLLDISRGTHRPPAGAQRHPGLLLLVGLMLLSFGHPVPAAAGTDVCIPNAGGVPALSGPPNWWDAAPGPPQFWPRPDDPRWRGAFVHLPMPGSATTEHVTFRALRTATSLYLIWYVTVDPFLDDNDQLWVAFSPGPGHDDMLINVVPFNSSNTDVPAVANAALPAPFAVTVATRTPPGAFAAPPSTPDWLEPATTHTRVYRRTADNSWAVFMEVPIAAAFDDGLPLGASFSMWFEVQVTHTVSTMVPYDFPSAVSFDDVATSMDDTGWQATQRTLAPSNPTCIQGVSLAVSDVGTVPAGASCGNPSDALSSDIALTNGAGSPGTNVLCARPLNQSGATISAGDIDATFRIANWGTQPDWNQVPNPLNTLWKTVNPTPATGGAITNTARGSLSFTWNLTANDGTVNDACTFDPQPPGLGCAAVPAADRRKRHQCMLVELSGAPPLTFSTSSVYRNMNFVNASTFRREAEVSVVGLAPQPTPQPQREVFLYVQTDNMPARIGGGAPPPPQPAPGGPSGTDEGPGFFTSDVNHPPRQVEPLEKSAYEKLRETEPTYQVHAFHDTGRTTTVHGRVYRILEPQTSFGYFVDHKGALSGWRHELLGAQQIAPNYYRIPVPENGTATVTTVIEAIEPNRWSLSLHAGVNDPHGDVGDACDGDLSWGADLEYRFNSTWAAELFYGHDEFDCHGETGKIDHLSLNGKAYLLSGFWRPFVGAGAGRYDFSPGGPHETGYNLFAGLQANPRLRLGAEATVRYHFVDVSGVSADFLTYHLGLRFRF